MNGVGPSRDQIVGQALNRPSGLVAGACSAPERGRAWRPNTVFTLVLCLSWLCYVRVLVCGCSVLAPCSIPRLPCRRLPTLSLCGPKPFMCAACPRRGRMQRSTAWAGVCVCVSVAALRPRCGYIIQCAAGPCPMGRRTSDALLSLSSDRQYFDPSAQASFASVNWLSGACCRSAPGEMAGSHRILNRRSTAGTAGTRSRVPEHGLLPSRFGSSLA